MKTLIILCPKFFLQTAIAIIIPSLIASCMPETKSTFDLGLRAATAQVVHSKRIYIYKDQVSSENRGHWTNMMVPEGAQTRNLIRFFSLGDNFKPLGGSGEAIRIDFELQPLEWAGIAVASCQNCWGKMPCPQPLVYTDLKGATRLVFHARGERGGEVIQVKAAITGDQQCGDSAFRPAESGYIRRWSPKFGQCAKL